ncbi:MAG: DUF1598 domain-containing protein [Pirellulales bacterium]|nr:DUF1598 domain-containing protein [Pirellulales bacterium]
MRLARRKWLVLAALLAGWFGAERDAAAQQVAGVHVDAEGVLKLQVHNDPTGELNRQRLAQGGAALTTEAAEASPLRKISLRQLEQAVAARIAAGQQLTDEMRYLGGLTRLQYVFYYPESKDIVIAGPAGPWAQDLSGRVVSVSTGRPVLQLEDLVVALRAYAPGVKNKKPIGCSIDPTREGQERLQQFLQQAYGNVTPADEAALVDGIRTNLGMQTVTVYGVPNKSHFATVMVEADYRMKLIGLGVERPPIPLTSYIEKARAGSLGRNGMVRWFFVPDYECVRVSDDGLAMELVGDGVKLVGESELVDSDGTRHRSTHVDKASQMFALGFTKKYPQLAERSPVYAQLRDVIDMAVAAAYVQQEDLYGKAGWDLGVFASEEKFPVETHAAPTQVETVVTSVWKGSQLVTPLGGGVVLHPKRALESDNLLADDKQTLRDSRQKAQVELAAGQWWWD